MGCRLLGQIVQIQLPPWQVCLSTQSSTSEIDGTTIPRRYPPIDTHQLNLLEYVGVHLDPRDVWASNNEKQGPEYRRKNGCIINTGSILFIQ